MTEPLQAKPAPTLVLTPKQITIAEGLRARLYGLKAADRGLDRDIHALLTGVDPQQPSRAPAVNALVVCLIKGGLER